MSHHPFSGLLERAACDGPMVIGGGEAGRRYYACSNSRRGRCKNRKTVLASVERTKLLAGFRERLSSPDGIAYARKKTAEHLGEMARNREAEIREKRARLARVDKRIGNLIGVLASGERSEAPMDQDPIAAREELRRYLDGAKVRLEIDENGNYVAKWALCP